jgi:predicted HicB family RNase H-like nuclease
MNLRMAPALKEGLQEAALAAGVSLNAYIVQVLAAAAGQRANFLDLHSPGSSANMD